MAPGAGFRTSRRRRSPGAMMRLVAPLSWLAALLFGAAFWWGVACALAGDNQADLGGSVLTYWASAQDDARPIRGVCASSCTMRLYKARCVDPAARLGFHAATHPIGTNIMLGMYAPPLRAYVRAHCLDGSLCWLSGAQVASIGGYRLSD